MVSQLSNTESFGTPTKVQSAIAFSLLLVTFGIALFLRLYRLGDLHYWFDESFSLRMSQFSLLEIILRCTQDTHPPLSFLVLKGWTALFGENEWATRMLSTLWSLGAVAAAFGFTYEELSKVPGTQTSFSRTVFASTVAALCLALSPMQIAWAQQVRMYAPVSCLSILSTWLLWRALDKHNSRTRWLLFGVVELVGLYTHVTMLFIFTGHLLALVAIAIQVRKTWSESKAQTVRSFVVMVLVGIAAMPWIIVVEMQHARVHNDFWVRPFDLQMLGEEIVKCFTLYQRPVSDPMIGLWIVQGMILVLLFVAAGRKQFDLLVTLTAASPFFLLVIVSLVDVNIVSSKYFIAGQSILWIVIGVAIAKLPGWILRIPVAAILISTMGYLSLDQHAWRREALAEGGIPELLSSWEEHRVEGEPLLLCNPMFYTTARIYSDEPSSLKVFLPEDFYYPFYFGTAIISDDENLTKDAIERSSMTTVWVCDVGSSQHHIQPVKLDDSWKLITETSMKDYSGTFFLRQYSRVSEKRVP